MNYKFDIVVIGGGAAGLFAASIANALGAKTALLDKKRLGGDCTWFGCMPSKALLKSAHVVNLLKRAWDFGLKTSESCNLDTQKVMTHVRGVVDEISTHHPPKVFEDRGVKVIFGEIKFIDQKTIEVNGERISAKKFIICTGSRAVVPPIEGLKSIDYLTNENIFDLDRLPKSLIVLGGGPIGIELSQALGRLGVKVSIVEMMDRLLFREEPQASNILEKKLKEEGVDIFTGRKAVKFEKKDGNVCVSLEDKESNQEQINAENVLIAVGRAPNVQGLSLEAADIKYTPKGIEVNKHLQTTNKNIFACGDVIGSYMFSHVAAYQAGVCVRNALFRRIAWQVANYSNIAWATFTDPEVAHLGLTEEDAKKKYKAIKVYQTEYTGCDRAITDNEREGLVKIITDNKGYILGANIVGANAGEIIQGLIIAKALKQPLSKIAPLLYIYPTLSELIKKTAAKNLIEKTNNPLIKLALKILRKK